jgi:hypothetical protein
MYIPISNIVETGYTQGSQYTLPDGSNYKGFYHKDNVGRYWTGKEHNMSSIQLTNLVGNISNTPIDLNFISKNNPISKKFTKIYDQNNDSPLLKNDIIQPTSEDYEKGYFTRYIAQLKASINPENNIVELNQNSFDTASRNGNVIRAYRFAIFKWKIAGPFYDLYRGDIRIEAGIIDTNLRSLQDVEKKSIHGITLFLKDPTQFASKPFGFALENSLVI